MKVIVIACILLIIFSNAVFGLVSEPYFSDSLLYLYEYPIKPGTSEWGKYSHTEHLEMLQIPDTVLNNISTEGLLRTCLEYPFISNIHAYDNYQLGMEYVISNFNGLKELLSRTDAGYLLVKEYVGLNPKDLRPDWSSKKRGEFKIYFIYLEMLLSQDKILSMLTPRERLELLESCLSKYSIKVWSEAYKSTYYWRTTAFLIGRILLKENYKYFIDKYDGDEKLRIFLDNPSRYTITELNEIVAAADLYMRNIRGDEVLNE